MIIIHFPDAAAFIELTSDTTPNATAKYKTTTALMAKYKTTTAVTPTGLSPGEPGTSWCEERAKISKRMECPFLAVSHAQGELDAQYDAENDTLLISKEDMMRVSLRAGLPEMLMAKLVKDNMTNYSQSAAAAERKKGMTEEEWKQILETPESKLVDCLKLKHCGLAHVSDSGVRDNAGSQPDAKALEANIFGPCAVEHDGQRVVYSSGLNKLALQNEVKKGELTTGSASAALALFVEAFGQVDKGDFWDKSYLTVADFKRMYLECRYPAGWMPHQMSMTEVVGEIASAKCGCNVACAIL